MKKLFLMLAILSLVFASCSKDEINKPNDGNDYYIVQLGWSGDILDIFEEPLTRASGNDLYGIQVYSCPDTEESNAYTPYAYGLFDDIEDITIKLLVGYKYKFESTMIVDGKNKLASNSEGAFLSPFNVDNGWISITNDFNFSSTIKMEPSKSLVSLKVGGTAYVPNLERFYGVTTDYKPSDNGNVDIDMKRVSFGAKFVAQGKFKQEGGEIKIQIPDAPVAYITYSAENNEHKYEDIYSFKDIVGAYNAAKDNDYVVEMDVNLSWIKSNGVTVPFGDYKVKFRRNKKTVINIKVDDKSSENGMGLILATTEITYGDEYTIDPGGSSDTDVEVN